MIKNKYLPISITIVIIALIFASIHSFTKSSDKKIIEKNLRIHSIFSSEEEYINHLKKNVHFDSIEFNIVEIKRGDNFWKIAKKHSVNIDTLLGTNPYWDTLVAKVKQRIIVASKRGVLHFINDFDEIEELMKIYKTDRNKIIIQQLPLLYRYYYKIFGSIGPIAVFIKDARPTSYAMTDKMAKQFCLREMFRSPLGGRLSSFFGGRIHPIFKKHRFHNGIDIAAKHGTLVGAACRGKIVSTGWMGGYGKAIIISHPNGFRTLYGHLSRIYVKTGQHVKSGRIIGRVGSTGWSTGPHLHFTLWHNGKLINPMKVLW